MFLHVLPLGDIKAHEESTTCPCDPSVIYDEGGDVIVVHNSFDGREGIEWVKELLEK